MASLKDRTLRLFDFAVDGTLLSEVVVTRLNSENARFRTPMMGPDGALYISTSNGGGTDKILKVVPPKPPEFDNESATAEVAENAAIGTIVATIGRYRPQRPHAHLLAERNRRGPLRSDRHGLRGPGDPRSKPRL